MSVVRWSILTCILLLAAGVIYDVSRRTGSAAAPPEEGAAQVERPAPPRSKWNGSASCAGRSCHGGIEPREGSACQQNEVTTIAALDPHARAYRVLLEQRSRDMVRRLGRADGNAHRDQRCTACHATPADDTGEEWIASEKAFGVGCESCHGPAQNWLHRHYEKDANPMAAEHVPHAGRVANERMPVPLDQPNLRAKTCAACHVGSEHGQNVDHDMIAAGHPRLLFEFTSLQNALPVHWRPRKRDISLDWFVGQIEGARAALELLRERAGGAAHPWPEFAEFDCFACHHDLKAKSWRQRTQAKSKPGTLPWNSWTYEIVTRLLDEHGLSKAAWIDLRHAMETLTADREQVRAATLRAQASLEELLKFSPQWSQANEGAAKLRGFLHRGHWPAAESWEAAEQYYFALRALQAMTTDPELDRRLDELEKHRGFDAAFTSPRRFEPKTFFGTR